MNPLLTRAMIRLARQFLGVWLLLLFRSRQGDFWQAWVYLAVSLAGQLLIVLWLAKYDPALLGRRLKIGGMSETRFLQKLLMVLVAVFFVLKMATCRIDHHFGWSQIPWPVIIAGDIGILLGLWIQFVVFRENTFGSATIEIMAGQKVISSGPYAQVRHPMYSSMLLINFAAAIALGSWYALLFAAAIAVIFIVRLFDEEKMLRQNLPGYPEYCQKVRYRLIPFVW